MATRSGILAWAKSRTEEPDGPQAMGHIKVDLKNSVFYFALSTLTAQSRNGNPDRCKILSRSVILWDTD